MSAFDVVVIGGGSAGSSAAAAAARAGARTALVNDGELGGLCILRGCMPTKALLATAHAVHETTVLERFGARLEGTVAVDFRAVMARKAEQVARFKRAKVASIESGDYELIRGRGRFVAPGVLEVGDRRLRASSWVVATGSEPASIEIPGIDLVPVWTSDDVMELERQPTSLVVQGAGAVGLELAQFFARIGTRVLLVNRSPLLRWMDGEAGRELTQALAEEEPRLELAVSGEILRLEPDGGGLVAHVRSRGETWEYRADALLMAVGRLPLLDGLGLEHMGLAPRDGILEHDRFMRTGNPAVWVAGDVSGGQQILHVANQEGRAAGHNAAGGEPCMEVDRRLDMQVLFTDPAYAQLGVSPDDAVHRGLDVVVGRARFSETGRAITMGVRHGLWKLVVDRRSRELLGTVILGPRADDLVHVVMALLHHRARADELLELPWYHPTLSEVMIDVTRDALRQLKGETPFDAAERE